MDKKLDTINITSSGNLVSVIMDKNKRVLSINIDNTLLDKSQKELLEEFIVSTINEASEKVDNLKAEESSEDNNTHTERKIPNADFFSMDKVNKIASDLSKLTSIGKDENGKPVINIPIDSINPSMIKNMLDMLKDDKDKK